MEQLLAGVAEAWLVLSAPCAVSCTPTHHRSSGLMAIGFVLVGTWTVAGVRPEILEKKKISADQAMLALSSADTHKGAKERPGGLLWCYSPPPA